MSLEKAIQENTEAVRALIAVMQGNTKQAPAEVAPARATPVAAPAAPAETPPALSYADVQKPFLKLVSANRDAALALLAEMEVKSLKGIEDKPATFSDVLARIEAAMGAANG